MVKMRVTPELNDDAVGRWTVSQPRGPRRTNGRHSFSLWTSYNVVAGRTRRSWLSRRRSCGDVLGSGATGGLRGASSCREKSSSLRQTTGSFRRDRGCRPYRHER